MPLNQFGQWTCQVIPDPITGNYNVPQIAPPPAPGGKGPLLAANALALVQKEVG